MSELGGGNKDFGGGSSKVFPCPEGHLLWEAPILVSEDLSPLQPNRSPPSQGFTLSPCANNTPEVVLVGCAVRGKPRANRVTEVVRFKVPPKARLNITRKIQIGYRIKARRNFCRRFFLYGLLVPRSTVQPQERGSRGPCFPAASHPPLPSRPGHSRRAQEHTLRDVDQDCAQRQRDPWSGGARSPPKPCPLFSPPLL